MSRVKLSILCLTYNQSKYIKQTLDSFLSQKTDFEYEILINDDASNDGTVEIIKDYQRKNPKMIKPIFQKENQYSKGLRNFMLRYLIPNAKGEYLALCEGDDYWTDDSKLQRQVDFLDRHPSYSVCFHPVRIHFENSEEPDSVYPNTTDGKTFNLKRLLKENYIQTNSVIYRRGVYDQLNLDAVPGDWYLHLIHAKMGKIGFINRVMSIYRRHSGGVWWNTVRGGDIDDIWTTYGAGHLALYTNLLRLFSDNPQYLSIIDGHIGGTISAMMRVDSERKTKLVEDFIKLPENINKELTLSLSRVIYQYDADKNAADNKLRSTLEQLSAKDAINSAQRAEISHLSTELAQLRSSYAYRIGRLFTLPTRVIRALFGRVWR